MRGRQLPDLAHHRSRRRDEAEHQIRGQRLRIDLPGRQFCIEERRQFGAEIESAISDDVVQRLFAQAIAREKESFLPRIPKRERKHPAQKPKHLDPVLFVKVDERFGVAVGPEAMAAFFQVARATRDSCKSPH